MSYCITFSKDMARHSIYQEQIDSIRKCLYNSTEARDDVVGGVTGH